jgi:hypothetical protein
MWVFDITWNCLWWPCLLTDRDEMSNLHRAHSIDTSCHVSVNFAKLFQRRRFKKIGQSETRITWRPSFVVCHLLTFHILIFSSENHQPNELKFSRKHIWKVLSKECTFCYDPKIFLDIDQSETRIACGGHVY